MTFEVRTVSLSCDGCHTKFPETSNNVPNVRTLARKQGWGKHRKGHKDFCPDCYGGYLLRRALTTHQGSDL
jgi:rRNA maturation endonuclease Nob1